MTEPEKNSAMPELAGNTGEPPSQPAAVLQPERNKGGGIAITLGVLALLIALASAGGMYFWAKRQADSQRMLHTALTSQLNELHTRQHDLQASLDNSRQNQQQFVQESQQQTQSLVQQLDGLQQKMAEISGADASNWLLAQAGFLVKMAGYKLWGDQDSVTAVVLLKNADTSLADMRDPGLIGARRAIAADIATLQALNQVDYYGIILELDQLANQVDNLRLADNAPDSQSADSDKGQLSSSLSQWRQNLEKSWHNFLDNFITIRRRDSSDVPLLAPDQEIYLRENIRSRLLIAAQAIPRHQQEVYQQALEHVASWVRAYYNTDDAITSAFLSRIDQLSNQAINMDLPESLQSQPVLDRLIQIRLRNLPDSATPADAGEF